LTWVYDIYQFSQLYREHEEFGDGGKSDFVEAAISYVQEKGGLEEVLAIFERLWKGLVRLAVGVITRQPCIADDQ